MGREGMAFVVGSAALSYLLGLGYLRTLRRLTVFLAAVVEVAPCTAFGMG